MIDVVSLSKHYRVSKRGSGLTSAVKQFIHPTFETVRAIKDISFHIDPGEIVGYMGPNGAGKSTTIKVMSGILTPTSGTCMIDGKVPWESRKSHVANIGVVFGQRSQLWWDTPVVDSFKLLQAIYQIPNKIYLKTFEHLCETLDLKPLLTTPVRQLSLGQRMRCEIAASLIHQPKILFLDEPTIGLDATSKIAIRNFIKTINQERQVTVILTTHDTSDLEALCKRVMLIGRGEMLYDGSLKTLKETYMPMKTLKVKVGFSSNDFSQSLGLKFNWHSVDTQTLSCSFNAQETSVKELLDDISSGYEVLDLEILTPQVDEMVVNLYKEHSL